MYPCSFRRTMRFYSIVLDSVPSCDKTKGLKSIGYYDGYKNLSWCALTDGSVTQGSLCLAVNPTARVRFLPEFYFFSILLKLEFYIFCNSDQVRYFAYFLTVGSVFVWAHNTSLQNSFTPLNSFKEN